MAKYYVKMGELKTEGEEIQRYAKDTVGAKVQELIDMSDKLQWEGPTYEMFITLYTDKIKKIKYLAKMIEMYGKFMVMASEGYTEVNDKLEKEWQMVINEINHQKAK